MEFTFLVTLVVNLLAAGLQSGTVILYATIGEIFSERAGVLNLGVEGMMLMGAVTAYGIAHQSGNPWLGLLAAAGVGALLALIHALFTVTLRADQVVSGLALTFLGSGMSAVLGAPLVEARQVAQLPDIAIPGLAGLPWLGPIFFQQNVIVYVGFLIAPLAWFYIYRTRPGLTLRAIGEYPAAADVLGINIYRQQYLYIIVGGIFAGISGASLTLAITPFWVDGVTKGQGWIAVGLVIFAGWNPLRAALGSYLFGAIRRLPLDMQNVPFFLRSPHLGYFLNMLPYLFTIVVLVAASREAMRRRIGSPAALGVPYIREERGR
ncbi:MAG: ABC transporter permease [Caldilineaceae bacterium]